MMDWDKIMSRPDYTDAEKDALWQAHFDARGMKYDPIIKPKSAIRSLAKQGDEQ